MGSRDGAGERTAVVFYGAAFALGSAFFNLIWRHARRARLLGETTDEQTEKALTRRFGLAVPLYLAGTLCGAVLPVLGFAIFAAPAIFFWLPLGQRATYDELADHPRGGAPA
jgi:hypothetical protein